MDHCEIQRCRAEADITYLGHGVCEKHWNELTADDARPDRLREALGIEAAPVAAMEEAMDDGTKKGKVETAEAVPEKSKPARPKKAPKEPAAKEPKRTKLENPVVFAFRLSEAERTRIHDAAGSGKASQFVLTAALSAAEKVLSNRATK